MPFPTGFPPRSSSNRRSIRFFVADTATANFNDKAYLFKDDVGANTYTTLPIIRAGDTTTVVHVGSPSSPESTNPDLLVFSHSIRIFNDGGSDLEFSFDGSVVHGIVKSGKEALYEFRHEAGIAVRGAGVAYRIEAW